MTTTITRDATAATSASFRAAGSPRASEVSEAAGPSDRDHLQPPAAEVVRRVVVLLLDHRRASWVAIRRAVEMSDALDAGLHVVLTIPTATTARHPSLVARHVAELLTERTPRCGFELEVIKGSLTDLGREIARDEAAMLVVVDARFGSKPACELADDLGVPVLIARNGRDSGDWIAASDMRHLRYPVLATARRLAHPFDRDVIYFHNAQPLPVFIGEPLAGPATYAGMLRLQDDAAAAKRSRLESLAASERSSHSFVARSGSTVDAVLDLARDRNADMVVVGHHHRSWLRRLFGAGTAEQIIRRSRRSVLIVPLDRGL